MALPKLPKGGCARARQVAVVALVLAAFMVINSAMSRYSEPGTVIIPGRTGQFAPSPELVAVLQGTDPERCAQFRAELASLVGELRDSYKSAQELALGMAAGDEFVDDVSRLWRGEFYLLKARLFPQPVCPEMMTEKAASIRLWRDVSLYEKETVARLWDAGAAEKNLSRTGMIEEELVRLSESVRG